MRPIFFLLIFSLFFNGKPLRYQTDPFKSSGNLKEGNRWEGIEDMEVSAGFALLAFHRERLTSYVPNDNLSIRFFMPESGNVSIVAKTITPAIVKYKMIVQKSEWLTGWQVFNPWSVNAVLVPNQIKANNLGVLILYKNKQILPASILKDGNEIGIGNTYNMFLNTPTKIKSLKYDVINVSGQAVFSNTVIDKEAQSQFYIPISMTNIEDGWYKVKIEIVWHNDNKANKEYEFYHKKK